MNKINPLLLEIPEQFGSKRLDIRAIKPGEGAAIQAAVAESIDQLRLWMPWAQKLNTPDEQEVWCRQVYSKWLARQDLTLGLWLKGTQTYIGGSGFHRIDWNVPKFEIGYWLRTGYTGQGYCTEAVEAVARFAFEVLAARRVEIRTDSRNEKSWRVAERCGFALEGILRSESRAPDGALRDTRVYAKVRADDAAPPSGQSAHNEPPT